jgi:hypothetical protein
VIASTGWGWEQARTELDIPRLKALMSYWDRSPPTHVLVAGFFGYKPARGGNSPSEEFRSTDTAEIMDALMQGSQADV